MAPQGHWLNGHDLRDKIYDGTTTRNHYLSHGLGLLVDGQTGKELLGTVDEFQPWIGWRNDSLGGHLDIDFEFDAPRNFTLLRVYVYNSRKKHIRSFTEAKLYFSATNDFNLTSFLTYKHDMDVFTESPSWIAIVIPNKIAKFIKCQFKFSDEWLLISEIDFISSVALDLESDNEIKILKPNTIETTKIWKKFENSKSNGKISLDDLTISSVALIIGFIVFFIVFCTAVLIFAIFKRKKLHKKYLSPTYTGLGHHHDGGGGNRQTERINVDVKNMQMTVVSSSDEVVGCICPTATTRKNPLSVRFGGFLRPISKLIGLPRSDDSKEFRYLSAKSSDFNTDSSECTDPVNSTYSGTAPLIPPQVPLCYRAKSVTKINHQKSDGVYSTLKSIYGSGKFPSNPRGEKIPGSLHYASTVIVVPDDYRTSPKSPK
uniref:Discoidin domain-containing protein n=1 Tax=Romanomermis culicivorax TaxID=13658 RepID=A0A915KRS1_ROMCU